jgi:hypothetical protein
MLLKHILCIKLFMHILFIKFVGKVSQNTFDIISRQKSTTIKRCCIKQNQFSKTYTKEVIKQFYLSTEISKLESNIK